MATVARRVVLLTIPCRCAARIPALTPGARPKSSAFTMRRRVIDRSLRQDALDHQPLDGLRLAGRDRGFGVEGADVLQTLVPDPGGRLHLAGNDRRRQPDGLELREGGLLAEEREEREDEPAARPEMAAGALDDAIQ